MVDHKSDNLYSYIILVLYNRQINLLGEVIGDFSKTHFKYGKGLLIWCTSNFNGKSSLPGMHHSFEVGGGFT
jgi:hypothetical protein